MRRHKQKQRIQYGCNSRRNKLGGSGSGCGSCGCPIAPMSWSQMNKYGGGNSRPNDVYPKVLNQPVITDNDYATGRILGIAQKGGFYNNSLVKPIPGPIVGANNTPFHTPGSNGVGGDFNHYALNNSNQAINNSPTAFLQPADVNAGYTTLSSMVGGKSRRRRRYKSRSRRYKGGYQYRRQSRKPHRRQFGGGDLLNLGRNFVFNARSAYNTLNAYPAPVNPLPYKDQLTNTNSISTVASNI